MTEAVAASRPLITPRGLLLRGLAVGAVVAAAAWPRITAGGMPAMSGLHPPRLQLLAEAPAVIRLHIAAAVLAFLIGSALLAGVKGSALHRTLGWTWCAAMLVTAVSSLFIKVVNPGHWSFIHFLSGWVIIAVPMAVVAVRRRNVRLHRRLMTGLFVGGLVIAGAFTFAPGRLMWQVFLG